MAKQHIEKLYGKKLSEIDDDVNDFNELADPLRKTINCLLNNDIDTAVETVVIESDEAMAVDKSEYGMNAISSKAFTLHF